MVDSTNSRARKNLNPNLNMLLPIKSILNSKSTNTQKLTKANSDLKNHCKNTEINNVNVPIPLSVLKDYYENDVCSSNKHTLNTINKKDIEIQFDHNVGSSRIGSMTKLCPVVNEKKTLAKYKSIAGSLSSSKVGMFFIYKTIANNYVSSKKVTDRNFMLEKILLEYKLLEKNIGGKSVSVKNPEIGINSPTFNSNKIAIHTFAVPQALPSYKKIIINDEKIKENIKASMLPIIKNEKTEQCLSLKRQYNIQSKSKVLTRLTSDDKDYVKKHYMKRKTIDKSHIKNNSTPLLMLMAFSIHERNFQQKFPAFQLHPLIPVDRKSVV